MHILSNSMQMVVCIHAVFSASQDESSPFGILDLARDKYTGNVNFIYLALVNIIRVCISVSAFKVSAFSDSFDVGFSISHGLQEVLYRKVD